MEMKDEGINHWRSVLEIYGAARELDPGQRNKYVESVAQTPEIANEVFQLFVEEDLQFDPRPGLKAGRYDLLWLLGSGGSGKVFAAHDSELNRRVAIKFLDSNAALLDPMRLIQEAQSASALNHPGIITVFEVLSFGGTVAMVTELVEGESLRRRCREAQPASDVIRWGAELARALAAAHAKRVVHGDIKPENIMLRPDGYLKLLDFGLARRVETIGASELPLGTVGYMSPEQVSGRPINAASDIFSLGIVLWELVAGQHPFLQRTGAATTQAILGGQPVIDLQGIPSSSPLGKLLRLMLAADPEQRPTAESVAAALQRLDRRRPRKTGLLAGGAFAVATLAIAWMVTGPFSPIHQSSRPILKTQRLTSLEGSETSPTFSPDGKKIVFCWAHTAGGPRNLFLKGIGSESPQPLTHTAFDDSNPTFSPDGSQVAFTRLQPSASSPVLLTVSVANGTERVWGNIFDTENYPGIISWWPDGGSLVVRDKWDGQIRLVRLFPNGQKQPLSSPPSTDVDFMPTFSPDDHVLAFLRTTGLAATQVCLLPLPFGTETCIYQGPKLEALEWTPDGKALLFAERGGVSRLPVNGTRSNEPEKLFDGNFGRLRFDRSARRLVYIQQLTDANLYRVSSGRRPEKLIASSELDLDPEYSPDGKQIVFSSRRSGYDELWVTDAKGLNPVQLTYLQGHAAGQRWSPDGKWIAFDGRPGGKSDTRFSNVYVVPAKGGAPIRFTDDSNSYLWPAWSQDSKSLFYIREDGSRRETWQQPLAGGKPVRISEDGLLDLVQSADGKSLFYTSPWKGKGIRRMSLPVGTESIIKGTENVQALRYWGAVRTGIYFVPDGTTSLRFFEFQSGRVTAQADLEGSFVVGPRGLGVSPDGKSVVYARTDLDVSDIYITTW